MQRLTLSITAGLFFLAISSGAHAGTALGSCPASGRLTEISSGQIVYCDNQLLVHINCNLGCAIDGVEAVGSSTGNLLSAAGYLWGASPTKVHDGGDGFGQRRAKPAPQENQYVSYTLKQTPAGAQLDWYQTPHTYYSGKDTGFQTWGSYTFPYNTGVIRVWHKFVVADIAAFNSAYPDANQTLSSFSANLNVNPVVLDSIFWPTPNLSAQPAGSHHPDPDLTYAIIGGDWTQPTGSNWQYPNNCPGISRYLTEPNVVPGLFSALISDARCHPRYRAGSDSPTPDKSAEYLRTNAVWLTKVSATQLGNPQNFPYMLHYSTKANVGIVRVLTTNSNRNLTFQTHDNGTYLIRDQLYSCGLSWDWADGVLQDWHFSGYKAPTLQNGDEIDTGEDLWIGAGSPRSILERVRATYPIALPMAESPALP